MVKAIEKPVIDFSEYPRIGAEDWNYTFETAKIRALEMGMLSKSLLADMANSGNFDAAMDLLGSSEYAIGQGQRNFAEIENVLLGRRSSVGKLFADLIKDDAIVELLGAKIDFTNLRLGLRRKLTDKEVGTDYRDDGNVAADIFERILGEENYGLFPEHMQNAIERAVLAYYQDKQIRQIDYAIDGVEAEYNIQRASELGSEFLLGLFRIRIDLINIRTMFRLKLTESEERNVFLDGGYIEIEQLKHGIDAGYEAMGQMFFATPYCKMVEAGAEYAGSKGSFLMLEQKCDEYMAGYLKTTGQITAGPQPIIAYLLMKENEIRRVRLVVTAKKNNLDASFVIDRIGG